MPFCPYCGTLIAHHPTATVIGYRFHVLCAIYFLLSRYPWILEELRKEFEKGGDL